jgi:hypothetical protein
VPPAARLEASRNCQRPLAELPTEDLRRKINEGRDTCTIINAGREERAAAKDYRVPDNSFPAFTRRFSLYVYLEGFNPISITKYDGKRAPQ